MKILSMISFALLILAGAAQAGDGEGANCGCRKVPNRTGLFCSDGRYLPDKPAARGVGVGSVPAGCSHNADGSWTCNNVRHEAPTDRCFPVKK